MRDCLCCCATRATARACSTSCAAKAPALVAFLAVRGARQGGGVSSKRTVENKRAETAKQRAKGRLPPLGTVCRDRGGCARTECDDEAHQAALREAQEREQLVADPGAQGLVVHSAQGWVPVYGIIARSMALSS